MKKIVGSVVLLMFIICGSFSQLRAQDGVFSDARTLGHRQLSLGIQPVIYTELNNDKFMLILRGAYGLQPGISFHAKMGVLRNETYYGGHLEYSLAGEPYNPISLSLIGGAYSFGDMGLKLGGVLSKRIGQFSLYSGLMFEPLFTDPEPRTPLLLPLGIDIPVSGSHSNFVFEVNLALNDDAEIYEALHFGFNFYF